MDRVELAKSAFLNGFNCTQAVLSAFAEDLELDAGTATRLAECFGGTTCNAGLPCGALLGAYLVAGLYAGRAEAEDFSAKARTERLRADLTRDFTARFGATDCRALLDADITSPEGMAAARASGALLRCREYVAYAAELTERMLREDPPA